MTAVATEYHEFVNHKHVSLYSKMFRSTTRPSSGKALKVLTEGILSRLMTTTKYADITQ